MLVVNPRKAPVKTVAELIDHLKQNKRKMNFGSSGSGSSIHFAGELFKQMTGTTVEHVPYRGSAPAMTDLLAGNVDCMFDNMSKRLATGAAGFVAGIGRRERRTHAAGTGCPNDC